MKIQSFIMALNSLCYYLWCMHKTRQDPVWTAHLLFVIGDFLDGMLENLSSNRVFQQKVTIQWNCEVLCIVLKEKDTCVVQDFQEDWWEQGTLPSVLSKGAACSRCFVSYLLSSKASGICWRLVMMNFSISFGFWVNNYQTINY